MSWYGLSVFSLTYVLAAAIPGPGVAAIIARSLGHGLRGAPADLKYRVRLCVYLYRWT